MAAITRDQSYLYKLHLVVGYSVILVQVSAFIDFLSCTKLICVMCRIQDFPQGGGLPRRLRFENFVCQNERIWTLGVAFAGHAPRRSANGILQDREN